MLLVVLYGILCLLCFVAFMQFIQLPRTSANRFLGIAMCLVGLGLFQSTYFLEPLSTRIHVILLLPLNLIFLPYWFSIKYMESLAQKALFAPRFGFLVKLFALIEIAAHLLPLGVIIFTGEYSRALLDFLFRIRSFVYVGFLLMSFWALLSGVQTIRKIKVQLGLDAKIYFGIRLFLIMTVMLALLIVASVLLPLFVKVDKLIFYIPQLVIALYFIGWGVVNFIINQRITTDFVSEYRDVIKNENSYYIQLMHLLDEDKIYRNPNLRIADVAENLGISPNYLSRLINEMSDNGFNDLINRYRVEELKEKIKNKEYQTKTLVSLALEVGFSSKSTFQSVFKKITSQTPTEYKAEVEKK